MRKQRRIDVLTVGEALIDLVAPDARDLRTAERFLRAPGGAPANVACAVAHLGGRAELVGAVGDDEFGLLLKDVLHDFGVGLDSLRVVEARTTLALVASAGSGPPNFVFYRGADRTLSPDDIPPHRIAESSFVHVSSMALLEEPARSATLRAVDLAGEMGASVSLDPNIRLSSWSSREEASDTLVPLIAAADVLKVSADEAEVLTGETQPERAIQRLGREDALAVITLGSDGCVWRHQGEGGRIPAVPVTVVETTGAGDAFVGALLYRLAREGADLDTLAPNRLEACLRFASAAAAITCTKPGAMAALPTYDQVMDLLERVDPPG